MMERDWNAEAAAEIINSSDESVEALAADSEIDLGDEDLGDLEDGIDELNFDPDESFGGGSGEDSE